MTQTGWFPVANQLWYKINHDIIFIYLSWNRCKWCAFRIQQCWDLTWDKRATNLQTTFWNVFSYKNFIKFWFNFHRTKGPIYNEPTFVQIMAWYRTGDMSLFGPMLAKITDVSRAATSNYIPQILWDVIMCPCPWYPLQARKSSYHNSKFSSGYACRQKILRYHELIRLMGLISSWRYI